MYNLYNLPPTQQRIAALNQLTEEFPTTHNFFIAPDRCYSFEKVADEVIKLVKDLKRFAESGYDPRCTPDGIVVVI